MIAGTRGIQHRSGLFAAAGLALLSLAVAAPQVHAKPAQAKPTLAKHSKHRPAAKERPVFKIPNAQFAAVAWTEIGGWADDNHAAAFATFLVSCKAILKGTPAMRAARPMYGALHDVCGRAVALPSPDATAAREFFEQNFRPVRISPVGEADGFITGYYEPVIEGKLQPDDTFAHPLYRKPSGLLPGGRMLGTAKFSAKKAARRIGKRLLAQFFDRARIEDGALAGRNLEICYLKDPVDAFFIHIQGSARVKLDNGAMLRLNYAAANGHAYTAVGKYLIERNIISRDEMSMEKIRQWMYANPDDGADLRRKNKSYVFFRETGLSEDEEPVGAQGVSLTPGRSIAVDRKLHVYGTPFFIDAKLPIDGEASTTPLRRLMVAQDTGGAIIGPARADIYWGAGVEAGVISGRFKNPGKFVMLLPKALDPFVTPAKTDDVPLPRPRPASEPIAAKPEAKIIVTQTAPHPVAKKPAAAKQAEPQSLMSPIFAPKTTKPPPPKKTAPPTAAPKKPAPKSVASKTPPKT